MQYYKEEAQAVEHLSKLYKLLVESGIEKEEESKARMYVEMMKRYGRGSRWCENKLADLRLAGEFA